MATNVIMPQLGESVVEGTISRWLVEEGQAVEKYDAIMEVSTDKVDTEIPAPATGIVLKIYFAEGQTLRAGTAIAVIGQPGEAVPDGPAVLDLRAHEGEALVATQEVPAAASPAPGAGRRDLERISPVVARMAREHHVDLNQVTGTGREGRITKKDLLAFIEARDQASQAQAIEAKRAPRERSGTPDDLPLAPEKPAVAPTSPAEAGPAEELVPHSRLRRLIAEHMAFSKRTSPHVTTVMEADMTAVVAHRARQRAAFAAQGVNLTFTPYLIQATIAGLKAVPRANAVYREDSLLIQHRYHIGMATAIAEGLIVPVIHDADDYSLQGLARKVNDLVQRARAGQLKPDEVQGSTFTLTNHGTGGSLLATPIINQPNVGILGIGALQKRTVVISHGHPIEPSADDHIAIRPMVYLSFTFDHRALDGAEADGFLVAVKQALERWEG